MQFGQATEVEEAFLGCWTLLHLDFLAFAFGYAGATTLPSNMVDAGLFQVVSSVVGGCYKPSGDTLPQPLTLTACCRTMVIQRPVEAVRHQMEDAYNLNVAFTGLRKLLDLRVFARHLLVSRFYGNSGFHFSLALPYSTLALGWFGFPPSALLEVGV